MLPFLATVCMTAWRVAGHTPVTYVTELCDYVTKTRSCTPVAVRKGSAAVAAGANAMQADSAVAARHPDSRVRQLSAAWFANTSTASAAALSRAAETVKRQALGPQLRGAGAGRGLRLCGGTCSSGRNGELQLALQPLIARACIALQPV